MKKICFLLVLLFTLSSCNRIPPEERVIVKQESDSLLVLSVPNGKCMKCQGIMETGLGTELGVKQSILNLHTKEVSIVYDAEKISAEDLENKVEDLRLQFPCK